MVTTQSQSPAVVKFNMLYKEGYHLEARITPPVEALFAYKNFYAKYD